MLNLINIDEYKIKVAYFILNLINIHAKEDSLEYCLSNICKTIQRITRRQKVNRIEGECRDSLESRHHYKPMKTVLQIDATET